MKKVFVFVLIAACFACKSEENKNQDSVSPDENLTTSKAVEQYKGLIPCADCMGIEVVLTLNDDHSYVESNTYLTDKEGNPQHKEEGFYEWKGDTLLLSRKEGISKRYRTDTALMAFDMEGKLMNDEFGMKYNLKKVF